MIKLLLLTIISLKVDTLMIPWGNGDGELGLRIAQLEDAGPNYGPSAFDVEDGRLVFLDTYNKRIAIFSADGGFIQNYNIKNFFTNVCLWEGRIILSADYHDSLKFSIFEKSRMVETQSVSSSFPLVRNSIEFFKDYRNGKLHILYRTLEGKAIRTYHAVFDQGTIKIEDGEPETWENRFTVLGQDSFGNKILVRFDGKTFIFRRGKRVYQWKPVFFAQLHGAPYRIDRDGTLYIVNYKQRGVEILEVKW